MHGAAERLGCRVRGSQSAPLARPDLRSSSLSRLTSSLRLRSCAAHLRTGARMWRMRRANVHTCRCRRGLGLRRRFPCGRAWATATLQPTHTHVDCSACVSQPHARLWSVHRNRNGRCSPAQPLLGSPPRGGGDRGERHQGGGGDRPGNAFWCTYKSPIESSSQLRGAPPSGQHLVRDTALPDLLAAAAASWVLVARACFRCSALLLNRSRCWVASWSSSSRSKICVHSTCVCVCEFVRAGVWVGGQTRHGCYTP